MRNLNKGSGGVPSNVKPKRVLFETYDGGNFELQKCDFKEGVLGLVASERSCMDRSVQNDTTLKFLGGLVSKDSSQRPPYYIDMMNAVPEGCVLTYVGPGSPENITAMSIPNGTTIDTCPGVWCIQIAAPTPKAYERTVRAFF